MYLYLNCFFPGIANGILGLAGSKTFIHIQSIDLNLNDGCEKCDVAFDAGQLTNFCWGEM